ncbi:hypothetical protein HHI36_019302 [Cryptolaemus montrouzieri]|uniref:Uncharacterized protein n=1 Tax=Cryptolaemus montrouzieri TaxID=559131 RepID=A0ABD2P2T8_9CUCU
MFSRTKKCFANLMLEDEEADEVQIIPQQSASSDVESELEADNEDEYAPFGLQSKFEASNSANLQTVQNVESEENRNFDFGSYIYTPDYFSQRFWERSPERHTKCKSKV